MRLNSFHYSDLILKCLFWIRQESTFSEKAEAKCRVFTVDLVFIDNFKALKCHGYNSVGKPVIFGKST